MESQIRNIFSLFFLSFFAFNAFSIDHDVNNAPYDVVYNHIHYLKKGTYDELQASESFDIPNKKARIEAALQLKEILDAKVDPNSILNKTPDDPNYIDSTTKKHIYVLYDKLPQVYVSLEGNKWYYSQATIDAIPRLHKKIFPFGTNIWIKWFPINQNQEFLKLYPWQWAGIGIIFGSFLICFFLLKYVFRFVFNKILFKKYANEIQDIEKLKSVANLFSVWIGFKIFQLFIPTLFINPRYSMPVMIGVDFISALLIVFVVYKLVELIIFYSKQYAQKSGSQWDEQIVVVLQKFLKFIIVFLGLFYILNTLDVNIATIIAGLSVGGLALALAAQDTVKNFIASVMIFIDKPFKIGDTIKGDNFEGAVLEVGFRSTRIKTSDDSIVYISNSKLTEMTIDNKGYRVYKKFKTEITLPYNTPLEKVELFLKGIRHILLKNPYTKDASIGAHLTNIQAAGLTITINYTSKQYNQREELQQREFILKKILQLAELLHIKLFENNQLILEKNTENTSDTSPDYKEKLQHFYADIDKEFIKIK
jgi:MscS family membrane protein